MSSYSTSAPSGEHDGEGQDWDEVGEGFSVAAPAGAGGGGGGGPYSEYSTPAVGGARGGQRGGGGHYFYDSGGAVSGQVHSSGKGGVDGRQGVRDSQSPAWLFAAGAGLAARAAAAKHARQYRAAKLMVEEAIEAYLAGLRVDVDETRKVQASHATSQLLAMLEELNALVKQEQEQDASFLRARPALVGGGGDEEEDDDDAFGLDDLPQVPTHDPRQRANASDDDGDDAEHERARKTLQVQLKRVAIKIERAMKAEKARRLDDALRMYNQAAQQNLELLEEHTQLKGDKLYEDLSALTEDVIKRVQTVKARKRTRKGSASGPGQRRTNSRGVVSAAVAPKRKTVSRADLLTAEEVQVLRETSRINGIECLPFMEADVRRVNLSPDKPFRDPDGMLALSPKQRAVFGKWVRPRRLFRDPTMITMVSAKTIKQTLITDCSFISALSVAAAYEQKFNKPLITSCIYPQDANGIPQYNPYGKYMVRLLFNGYERRIIVDDFLPVDKNERLLCSFSTTPGELWVSILEKAFLKVMGGYNFPGSNGGIDLHVLTGWIPERVGTSSSEFDRDRTWERMSDALRRGDCLITTATGNMSEAEADEVGLVPSHAYAVLNVAQVGDVRLLQLKNPWSRKRWKGRYSPDDTQAWTPALRSALDYDRLREANMDNGIFWIDYDSLIQYYAAIYMNWNPDLFTKSRSVHGRWPANIGREVDKRTREKCPQYFLKVSTTNPRGGSIWILFSKHETMKRDEDLEYIAVHIYDGSSNERVILPENAVLSTTYINNMHHLTRYDVPAGKHSFRLVLSQYEINYPISYSVRAYFTGDDLVLREIPYHFEDDTTVGGEWKAGCAGGSSNHPDTYLQNPQFDLVVPMPTRVMLRLWTPKEVSAGITAFHIYETATKPAEQPNCGGRLRSLFETHDTRTQRNLASSGDYRYGYTYLLLPITEEFAFPCHLTIVASTYRPDTYGAFQLQAAAEHCKVRLRPL